MEKLEKKAVFSPYCGDETITSYDRACSSDVTGSIPSGVPRHGGFYFRAVFSGLGVLVLLLGIVFCLGDE